MKVRAALLPNLGFQNCGTSVDRLKEGPSVQWVQDLVIWLGENLPGWLGFKYVDTQFWGSEILYWWYAQDLGDIWSLEWDLFTWTTDFERLSQTFPDVPIYSEDEKVKNHTVYTKMNVM